ncbi:hypothetical protein [Shewanella sp.]|uniref:hypothetical protein n=1 Tax=Shewanella sp. TaxID=50422 RepID=UPI0040545C25
MLIKPIYELLPFTYMAIGGLSLLYLEPKYAIAAAILIYLLGARIYILRSNNRRTDLKRKRKQGIMPQTLYNYLPFLCILAASILYRLVPRDSSVLIAICLLTYGLYILMRRASYRNHRVPASSF